MLPINNLIRNHTKIKLQSIFWRSVHESLILRRKCEAGLSPNVSEKARHRPYKLISLLIAFPTIILLSFWNYREYMVHKRCYERPPFIKYTYLYIRSKRFPWGEGNKSLFHNPVTNALPDGYEA